MGVVWGTGTVTFGGTISSTGNSGHLTQSVTYERSSDVAKIKGSDGTVKSVVFSGKIESFRCSVIPSGSTLAAAATSAGSILPAVGAKVTVTDGSGAGGDDYYCVSATQNRTVDQALTVDLVLERGDEGVDLSVDVV